MKFIVAVVLLLLTAACSSPNQASWEARCDELVPGKYQACYGPGWDQQGPDNRPFDNFQISLERVYKTGSYVIVSRTFPAADVPANLLTRNFPSIVTFDPKSGKVTFTVGAQTVVGYTH